MMVNLYGYAGELDKVEEMLSRLQMELNASLWLSLLKVCVKHGNLQLGKQAFDCAVCLQPREATAYLLMSTIYVNAGLSDLANHLEISRQKEGALKKDETSWCEHQQRLFSFSVGDHRKLNQHRMYECLLELIRQLKDEAQFLGSKFLLSNAATTKLQPSLCSHSQLLALAFVLVNPPFKKPVRVKKNACICQDCHTLIKLISDVKNVCIIIVDDKCSHLFKRGKCSCHDYFYAHSKGE
ncbi:hypothetical protein GOP47_0007747 [Adiantum capillus-veneris]|nr:hypothetical protein GOP47_0007747 [Adiantum capillus-veneris]